MRLFTYLFSILWLNLLNGENAFSQKLTNTLMYSAADSERLLLGEDIYAFKFSKSKENEMYVSLQSCLINKINWADAGICTDIGQGDYFHLEDLRRLSQVLIIREKRIKDKVGVGLTIISLPIGGFIFKLTTKAIGWGVTFVAAPKVITSIASFILTAYLEVIAIEHGKEQYVIKTNNKTIDIDPSCLEESCQFPLYSKIELDVQVDIEKWGNRLDTFLSEKSTVYQFKKIASDDCNNCVRLEYTYTPHHVRDKRECLNSRKYE